MYPYSAIVVVTSALLLSACQRSEPSTMAAAAAPDMPGDPVTQGFDKATLSTLINSEMALRQGHEAQAAQALFTLSTQLESRDVAARAVQAARQANDRSLLHRALARWTQLHHDGTPLTDQDADIYRLLADNAATQGDWQEALRLQLALDAAGQQAHLNALAESLLNVHNAPLASLAQQLDQHLRRFPEHTDPAIARALLSYGMGKTQDAAQRLAQLRQHAPFNSNVLFATALVQQHRQQWQETLATAQQGLDNAPLDLRFSLLKLRALYALNHSDRAQSEIQSLLDRVAHPDELGLVLAKFLLECRQPDQALLLLQRLPEHMALDAEKEGRRHSLSGLAAEMKGDTPHALAEYQQINPESEPFAPAQVRQFQLLLATKGLDPAIQQLQAQCERYPERAAPIMELVVSILDQSHQQPQADAVLDEAIAAHPDNDDMRYIRAMRAVTRYDLPGIERDLPTLLQHQPDNPFYLNAYGYSLTELTPRYQEALALLKKAHAIAPQEAAISDSLGWTYYHLNDLDSAQHYLEMAHQQGERDPDIACHLATLYAKRQMTTQAKALIKPLQAAMPTLPALKTLLAQYPELRTD